MKGLLRLALPRKPMTYDMIVAAGLLLLASGCSATNEVHAGSGGMQGGGAPLPSIQIRANTIPDGTTNAGPGPFPVTFYGEGRMLDAGTLADLVSRLALTTWPEGTAVPVTTGVEPPTTTGTTSLMMATANVSVSDALAGRWYALRFGPPADGLSTQQTFDGGAWGVRLRPDSHPAVLLVEFCSVDARSGMKFIVSFSERVAVDNPATALTLRQGGEAVTCQLNSASGAEVHQYCSTLIAGPATVSLAASTVHDLSGSDLAAHDWPVDIAQLPVVETGCRGYRVPLTE